MEILENAKTTASEQFENVSQMVQEKIPTIKDSIQEQIPVIKNKFEDTINLCKTKFIPKEDRAEIYTLVTDPEKPEINEENEEAELPFHKRTKTFKTEYGVDNYDQEESGNAPREIDDKDYMRELIDICNQNGETPSYEDFNQNGWEHFYSADDPFFLWDKGQVIPNRLKVSNPHDYKKLEIYQGDMTPDLTTRQGFGILTTPFFVRIGQWRYNQFTGWGRESRRN